MMSVSLFFIGLGSVSETPPHSFFRRLHLLGREPEPGCAAEHGPLNLIQLR